MSKLKPLTPKQQRFVAEYLKDLSATQAAIRAGYAAGSAHVNGPRLLKYPQVKAAIAAKEQRIIQKAELSAERTLEELRRIAFLDPRRFYYPAGHPQAGMLKPVTELDEEVAACLAGNEVARANLNPTDGKRDEEWLHKIKYFDKLKALEMLAKHFALLKDIVDVTVTTDWEKLAARIASVRNEPIDPRQFLGPVPARRKGIKA